MKRFLNWFKLLVWKNRTAREKRLLVFFSVAVLFFGVDTWRRQWHWLHTLKSPHYLIYSSATMEQTRKMAEATEAQYRAYAGLFSRLPSFANQHPPLKMKLYRDRNEMRFCNRMSGWAEAFYLWPYCYAYYSAEEVNPFHWMLHEATHQLNHEVAGLGTAKWLDEGLSEYFSNSQLTNNTLLLGRIDRHAYPVNFIGGWGITADLDKDLQKGEFIPLRAIVTNRGGPNMNRYFNLYYLHWWSLTYFLFHYENGKYRPAMLEVMKAGGTLASFEHFVGPLEQIQREWHGYALELKNSPRPNRAIK